MKSEVVSLVYHTKDNVPQNVHQNQSEYNKQAA